MSGYGQVEPSRPLPYGEEQGSFMGVTASSNRDDGFFSGESNYVDHVVYTGFRYQCVEYARRFLLLTTGCVFASCGRASEIFAMRTLTHVETGATFEFIAHPNGKSTRRPTPGDIIVYPYHAKLLPWGHVGVISYADEQKVGIAEQNHTFTSFTSPGPDYLAGERCVSRYVDLETTADGCWRLKERDKDILDCLGWMSYPAAPRRETIHKPLKVLPEQQCVRATPVDREDHPCLWRLTLQEGTCPFRSLYVFRHGTGEALIGAVTAFSRIIRVTLEFLFKRHHLSAAFAALATNPRGAELLEVPKELNDIMEVAAHDGDNDALMDHVLAAYFCLSEDVVAAMRREFRLAATHMIATSTFRFNLASSASKRLESGVKVRCLKAGEFHDEAWLIEKVDFGNPVVLSALSKAAAASQSCKEALRRATWHDASCKTLCECRVDFVRYVKYVEKTRGSRAGFTIIKSPSCSGDDADAITTSLLAFCGTFQYPTSVLDESQVWYDLEHSRLYARSAAGANLHVDFCLCMTEWPDILSAATHSAQGTLAGRSALRQAAIDPRADVVFAKPLWSFLCSGGVHKSSGGATELGAKFFDISRRLYEFALPKQPPETWGRDVHEYRSSCRCCHLDNAPAPELVSKSFRAESVMVNFAVSCATGRAADGSIAGLMYLFS
ncbi:putative trypanothione synthetase [Trypanosoma conorhini]|uniref:Putative trypanothione synthetase n=1 Tax=Trypanosoma conorhini TaxID=83891 RepID=A0A422P107_9TRYP|nr:putative trypanothione synthetase [Trypanosoma conorhini]RNF11422.1 putative trypanothione synthetase [Trypanosoma conorhini]